jgi:dolichol kinase
LYFPKISGAPERLASMVLAVILTGSLVVEHIRFRVPALQRVFYSAVGSMLRSGEDRRLTGSTWIFASAFVCTLLFHREPHITFMVVSMFILGDAVAALVGQSVGRIRIGHKSLEGSAACLLLCLLLCAVVYPLVPSLLDVWGGRVPVPIIAAACLTTTLLELVPLRLSRRIELNDNLVVPVVTGLVIRALDRML